MSALSDPFQSNRGAGRETGVRAISATAVHAIISVTEQDHLAPLQSGLVARTRIGPCLLSDEQPVVALPPVVRRNVGRINAHLP